MRQSLLIVPLLLVAACAHDEKKNTENPTGQPAVQTQNTNTSRNQSSGGGCSHDEECGPKQLCVRGACVNIGADLAECSTARVHFDFDSADLRQDDRSTLERMARCVKADHGMHVTIEGNADERGTEEYNLALGDRRATAVQRYLELLGASDRQLKTVSYGKERPLCSEHDEDCWAKNRRAALETKQTAHR